MRVSLLLAATLLALPLMGSEKASSEKKLKSGLQPGEGVPAFHVVDVTGRFKAKPSVCYI